MDLEDKSALVLVYHHVLNLLIILISSNHKIMGHWTNKPWVTALGWLITLLMAVSGIAAIYSLF